MSRPFGYGEIPSGWYETKLRRMVSRRRETGRPELPLLSVNLPVGVVERVEGDGRPAPSDDLSSYQVVRVGDLVMNQLGKPHGALGVSPVDGVISPAYFVASLSPLVSPRFMHHMLRTRLYISEYERRGKFMPPNQFDINWEQFRDISVVVPPLEIQHKIADYLDAETARIDALIEKKQRMVTLLAEKASEVRRNFTRRGIRPGTMKDSGIPWIGEVPMRWDVVPNRAVMQLKRSIVGDRSAEYTLLSLTRGGVIVRDVSENFGKFPASFDTYQAVEPGDLIFCLFDVPETPRTVGLANHQGMVTGAYDVFTATGAADPRYLAHLYIGIDDEKSLSLLYTGLRNVIRRDTFLAMRTPLPPLDEQREIVETIERELSAIEQVRQLLASSVERLGEWRRAAVTAAVTGEFDLERAV